MKHPLTNRRLASSLVSLLISASALADTAATHTRTTTKVVDGVYVIRHPDAPDSFPQGNTTVIIGEQECLVVDSCLLPSSAKEDIAQIRRWTNKPVRYLFNTHWHFDHTNGNGLYAKEFPGLITIAHMETKKMIESYNPMSVSTYATRSERIKHMLETGKNEEGKALSDAVKKDITRSLQGIDQVVAEFKSIILMPPNLSFDHAVDIDLGHRQVQIRFLGRGHTAGDAIAYLPNEKIAVVGDLLVHPVPYFYGGFPAELTVTLRNLAQLDPQIFVPGHGDVLRDKAYLNLVIEFLDQVVPFVWKEVNSSRDTQEQVAQLVRKNLNLDGWKRKFAGENKENRDAFDETIESLIDVIYKEAKLR
jgi:cyclase